MTDFLQSRLLRAGVFTLTALAGLGSGAHATGPSAAELIQAFIGDAAPNAAAPVPFAMTDLGTVPPTDIFDLTLYLKPSNPAGLARFVSDVQTPGNPGFHRFLSEAQFVRRFAPSGGTLSLVETTLIAAGFTNISAFGNQMAVRFTGNAAQISAAFGVTLHMFSDVNGHGIGTTSQPIFPAAIAPLVEALGRLDTIIPVMPASSPSTPGPTRLTDQVFPAAFKQSTGVSDHPGSLTPADYEAIYDVSPLVKQHFDGTGKTIGIITTESFPTADPARFWSEYNIAQSASHLQTEYLDGATPTGYNLSDVRSFSESDLDIEQSGGIATGANVVAYVSAYLLDGYEQAASENKADVISSSFGTPELWFQHDGAEIDNSALPSAFHDVFLQMAAQGETVFVAAGDAGAFDANRNEAGFFQLFPTVGAPPAYTPIYSVNAIAADPLVTAAGGTTLPISGASQAISPSFTVTIAQEQPWSTSYLPASALLQNGDLNEAAILFETAFPAGGGGGVSTIWPVPDYQRRLSGIAKTQPSQALIQLGGTPALIAVEPAGFAGRNIPDLSANADPNSGYAEYANGFRHDEGGTSYVAPQLAGTFAIIDQALGHRVGQLNPLLYGLAASGAAPARDISAGNNWGYVARPGYDQTTGLGAIDAAKLFSELKGFD